ncbi:MAG: hypothetical protein ACLFUI_00245 [Halanaerobiales bacterium]
MEDLFGVIVWIAIIIGAIAKMVGKSTSENSSNKKTGSGGIEDISKKIEDFFGNTSPANTPQERKGIQSADQGAQDQGGYQTLRVQDNPANAGQRNRDDEWVPVYENTIDDRPLQQASGMDKGRDFLEKQSLGEKPGHNRKKSGHLELDDEITVRDGIHVRGKKMRSLSRRDNKRDAYGKVNTKSIQLNMENIEREDLVKGIIFKEIFDEPRAKRPYKPFRRV